MPKEDKEFEKRSNTLIAIVLIFSLLTIGLGLGIDKFLSYQEEKKLCNNIRILNLRVGELSYASKLADNIPGVVYIPEKKQMIARSEVLDCENFDYYQKTLFGGWNK